MKKKIILFSALGSLIIGATAAAVVGLTTPKKGDVFSTRALTAPTDAEEYDAWLNSWSKPNHLYVHYNRGDKNDYEAFCFWMWNDATDTDGTLWAYGGATERKNVVLNPMSTHWMYASDIQSGEAGTIYKDSYGVIADVDLTKSLTEGKYKKGSTPGSCSYDNCDDFGFLFPQISSMDGSAHWTSDGGKDNDVDDWKEDENWRTISGGKCIHIFFASGQLMDYSYYAGSGIPQVKENPIDKATDNRYDSATTNIPDKYPNQIAPTSSSFKKLGVGYQIFVASFRDSDGDGYGDLRGVIDSLDYLQDLGVQVLWLTPIQQCGSYHGYDIIDYYAVDKKFGTVDDYRELLFKAHQKGMKVLMDLVLNHTSKNNKWFINSEWGVNSYEGSPTDNTGIKWRDIYTWKYGTDEVLTAETNNDQYKSIKVPGNNAPCNYVTTTVAANAANANGASWFKNGESNYYYYGKFGSDMPELNYENAQTRKLVQDMAKYWMSFGLDGFRLDAVKHIYMKDEVSASSSQGDIILPDIGMKEAYDEQNEQMIYKPYDYSQDLTKNISFWKEFAIELKKVYPDCFLVGENFDGYGARMAGYIQALDSQFDFASYYHGEDSYTYSSAGSYGSKRTLETYGPAQQDGNSDITVEVKDLNGTKYNYSYNVPGGKRNDFINGAYTSNHDVYRAINKINSKCAGLTDTNSKVTGTAQEIGRAKVAGALALLNPGVSWIYYGDELGMSSNTNTHMSDYSSANCEDTWFRQPFIWQGEKGNKVRPHYQNGKYQFNSAHYDSYNASLLSSGKGVTLNADNSFSCNNEIYAFYKQVCALKKLYPENAKATFNWGTNVLEMKISGNGKSLLIYINFGFNGDYNINSTGYNSEPIMQINCSGQHGGTPSTNFGQCPYAVVAFSN